jgi:hypothetical protein
LLDHTVRPNPQRLIAATRPLSAMLSVRLAALFYTARHHADAMLRLRATQAALFREGILLHHEPCSHELPDPGLGSRLTPDVAAAISHTVSTAAATAAVLHLINPLTGLGYPVPRPPVLADLAADGSQPLTAHGPAPVPTCADAPPTGCGTAAWNCAPWPKCTPGPVTYDQAGHLRRQPARPRPA